MRFYDRENEISFLNSIRNRSISEAQMTVVVGRRRIGKTSLLKKVIENDTSALYLFVARKKETLICEEFKEEIEIKLQVSIFGSFTRFKDLFQYLMQLSESKNFTLIIDEFQEFNSINLTLFSEMQHIWDDYKGKSKINLILCGSVYSLMKKIFENSKEPLFSRATDRIFLKAFRISTLKEIITEYYPEYTSEDLLAFYIFTGGVAKYVELLVNKKAFTLSTILDEILNENSLFLDEGKNVLIDEFGKDYATYFSILTLIASSKTARSEIESILGISIGGYLERLENDFNLIKKIKPMFSKPGTRSIKYVISDNFLNFWFRFIYKYQSTVEIGNFKYLREIVMQNYKTYSGVMLEKYFREKLAADFVYSDIGSWWDRKNQNEIDIIAINELEKRILVAEVKRNPEKISLSVLKGKANNLQSMFEGYSFEYKGFSIEDM